MKLQPWHTEGYQILSDALVYLVLNKQDRDAETYHGAVMTIIEAANKIREEYRETHETHDHT